MKRLAPAVLALAAACTGTITDGRGTSNDTTPPTVEVTSPPRGTVTEDRSVVVAGRVTDDKSPVSLKVNGNAVEVNPDGSFSTTIEVGDGITLFDTIATDGAGNEANDARAVLSGTLVPQETPVAEGVVANLSGTAMNGLGQLVSSLANNTDFTALATALNPVVDAGGGCNEAQVYVESVSHGGVEVGVTPVAGGVQAAVSIRSLVVRGHVEFEAICINGSASWTISADAYDVGGVIAPTLASGTITIALAGVTSDFRGFNLDVNNIPGFIEDIFEDDVRDKLAQILRDKVNEMVPSLATAFLAEFLAGAWDISLLGQTISLGVTPSAMTWTEQGGTIALDTSATIEGVDGLYLSSPRPRPSDADMASTGIRVGLADDVLNQLLAAIWAAGALEDAMVPGDADALGAAFGGDVASATMTLMLPPVANFDTTTGSARLTLGDMMVTALDPSGATLASFVVSADIDLAVETSADGRVKVVTSTPRILAQVLEQSPTLLVPLDKLKVAAIAELAIKTLSLKADDLLANLPVPGLADASITSPSFQPAMGYMLLGGQIEFAPPAAP
ncbi:MAG TPA: hypothetical protein VFU21_01765 [Kofleriaceae bacterium]|nr:hypothetical protein [Kofleriaceae bacterium]